MLWLVWVTSELHKRCSGMRRWHGSYCQPSTVFPRMFFPTYLAFRSFSSAWGAMTPPLAWVGGAVTEAIQNLLFSIVCYGLCYFSNITDPLKLSQRPSAFANGASFALSFAAPWCCCHPETHPGRWSLNRTRPVFPWAIPGLTRAHNFTVTHSHCECIMCLFWKRLVGPWYSIWCSPVSFFPVECGNCVPANPFCDLSRLAFLVENLEKSFKKSGNPTFCTFRQFAMQKLSCAVVLQDTSGCPSLIWNAHTEKVLTMGCQATKHLREVLSWLHTSFFCDTMWYPIPYPYIPSSIIQ